MDLERTYIQTIAYYGSFSRAADALYITQPALSMAVKKAEQRLGVSLFDRTSKPVRLTEAGRIYLHTAETIGVLEQEMLQQMDDLSSLRQGTLKIGGTHYFNSYLLPPVLASFRERYPGVRLELTEAAANVLVHKLEDHAIDLCFNCAGLPEGSFLRTPCLEDHLLLSVPVPLLPDGVEQDHGFTAEEILAEEHLLSKRPTIPLSVFQNCPFLLLTEGNDLFSRAQVLFREADISPNVSMQVEQLVTAWHLSKAGLGAALISDRLVTDGVDNIRFFPIDSPIATRVFDLVYSKRHYISKPMTAFLDIFQTLYPYEKNA